jgi:hypothetical protein
MKPAVNPFHAGERAAQLRAGAQDVAEGIAGFIRPFMPDQHRNFFEQLPFLVLAGADVEGRHWVTLLDGPEGFVSAPDPGTLVLGAAPDPEDPLAGNLTEMADIGVLGIEFETRRRNRLSGRIRTDAGGLTIDVRQSFGNCPQHICPRRWRRALPTARAETHRSDRLSEEQITRIGTADTLFIGTGHNTPRAGAATGFDASHRGGAPGFVAVIDARRLLIPDYSGNNFFNSIGNLLLNARIGLVFVDFETGGLLHLTGRASVDWSPKNSHDPQAQRMIEVTVDAVVDRPNALSLRWSHDDGHVRELMVTNKVRETVNVTSFYLAATDGASLPPFTAGQYLPIELEIPGQTSLVQRNYSLSGSPAGDAWRISIKREPLGLASRHLHAEVEVGDRIRAHKPAGDFVVPCRNCPLVLASAGIGVTPMQSMLHAEAAAGTGRSVWFVHGARNGAEHALKAELEELAASLPNLSTYICYSHPDEHDVSGSDYQGTGRLTARSLLNLNPGPDAHYMLCGPSSFIISLRDGLEAAGVPARQIHFETF